MDGPGTEREEGEKRWPHVLSIQVSPRRVPGSCLQYVITPETKQKPPPPRILSGRKAFLLHLLGSRYLFMAIWGNVLEQSNGLLDLAAKFWAAQPSLSVTFYTEIPASPLSLTFALSHLGGLLNKNEESCAEAP